MAKISSLWVEIGANSAKFSQELKKTNSQAKSWSKSIKSTVGKAAGVFALVTAAVAATAAAITGLYTRQSEYIDNLAKQSSQLNMLVADFQAVKSAADFAGVGEGINAAMQRLSRGLGDAAKGTGEALKAVRELGLNAAELASKTATEQLQIVLDKLQEIPPGAERVSLAFQFFGRQGVGLVNLTSDAIRNARSEFDRWGVSITEQQAAWVEATNDNLSRLGKFMSGAGIQFSTKLAPMIGAASEGILKWAEETINWGSITDGVVNWIRKKWLEFKAAQDLVMLGWTKLKLKFNEFAREALEGISYLEVKVSSLLNLFGEDIARPTNGVKNWLDEINTSIEKSRVQIEGYASRLSTLGTGLDSSVYGKEFDKAINDFKRRAEEARKTGIALQSNLNVRLPTAANDPVTSSAVLPFQSNSVSDAIRERNLKAAREAAQAAKAAADAQKGHMQEIATQVKAVNGEIETFANRLGQGIAESAERGSQAIRDMVADMLIQLAKVKLQQAFAGSVSPIGGASSTFLGEIIGGLFSNQAVPAGAASASASLNAGASAAGYAPGVVNNIHVTASGDSSSAISSLRSGVRVLTETSPQQVVARAARGGSFAQAVNS